MKYVIAGVKEKLPHNPGVYCRFLDLPRWQEGVGGQCKWGKLSDATVFVTAEEAYRAIKHYSGWVSACGARVASIHPLNLSH